MSLVPPISRGYTTTDWCFSLHALASHQPLPPIPSWGSCIHCTPSVCINTAGEHGGIRQVTHTLLCLPRYPPRPGTAGPGHLSLTRTPAQIQPHGPPHCSQTGEPCSAVAAGELGALSSDSTGLFVSRLSWSAATLAVKASLSKIPIRDSSPQPPLCFCFPPYHLPQIKIFSF